MALPPVPLRVPVLERRLISRDWAVWLNALAKQIDLLTPAGTFANNAAAVAAGIAVGQTYQTATGEVRVVV
jgi:hypothetical protein